MLYQRLEDQLHYTWYGMEHGLFVFVSLSKEVKNKLETKRRRWWKWMLGVTWESDADLYTPLLRVSNVKITILVNHSKILIKFFEKICVEQFQPNLIHVRRKRRGK